MIDILCQIEILLLNRLKLLKIPDFSSFILSKLSNSRFFSGFQVKWQPCRPYRYRNLLKKKLDTDLSI